jgi:hypothetical protein
MNNSYDRGSLPGWAEFIIDRIAYHEEKQKYSQQVDDWDSADQHFSILEELHYLLDSFGFDNKDEE